jgi:hypothetical protein
MYKRITATGDPAIAIAKSVFKRPPDGMRKNGKKLHPRWLEPTVFECMRLASKAELQEKTTENEQRWEVVPGSSFWMLPTKS